MSQRQDLLFVSTRFLFPVDSGGKIRTTQVLRGLKGGDFRIVLVSPASDAEVEEHRADLESVCDEFHSWQKPHRGRLFYFTRLRYLLDPLPIPVRTDRHKGSCETTQGLLAERPDVAVFDFVHANVYAPAEFDCPTVLFTHNVEAEIFKRHVEVSENPVSRGIWSNQYRKMVEFERQSLRQFDVVVAVSERDRDKFAIDYGIEDAHVIPTGVDLEFFGYRSPERSQDVVFCGSMDWMANQEGIRYFMDEIWSDVIQAVPEAKMTVVGRSPPDSLVREARRRGFDWRFTGFVDDVRSYVQGAAVFVIPLRVGGGTRLKAYEAMAMGSPIVSTSIGMEGLPVTAGQHFLPADTPGEFAASIVKLIRDKARRLQLSEESRQFVEENFSYTVAAKSFETACKSAIHRFGQSRGQ